MSNGISAADAISAIKGSRGFVSVIASRLGVTRQTVYNLRDRYPTVAEALQDERESNKDWAESKLFKRMDKDDTTAIIFYLKTQAKDRGYIERQEIGGLDGKEIAIKVIRDDSAER
jgi:hypothetical protein